ncbi:MAG: hypothetical protein HY902_06945 [Deltaproteobacteria bacterium]|nr:hypothetical protein [Deltaproteobacteria bacterium]
MLTRISFGLLALAAPALAQPPSDLPQPATPAEVHAPAALPAKLGPELLLRSGDRQVQLQFRGLVQADTRTFLGDAAGKLTDQEVIRRARPIFAAKLGNLITAQLVVDFGQGTTTLMDAWANVRVADGLQVQVGKFHSPFGLERLRSGAALGFAERAYPSVLVPNRDVGIKIHGEVLGKRLGYALAALDGAANSSSADGDSGDGKDVVGRLYTTPFLHSDAAWLSGLLVGAAVSWGDQAGTATAPGLTAWKTTGQNTFFSVRQASTGKDSAGQTTSLPGVMAKGVRQRATVHTYWHAGPAALLAEWVRSSEQVQKGSDTGTLRADAWQMAVAYVVGGTAAWEGVQPAHPLTLGQPGWGALELAARWSHLRVDTADLNRWVDFGTSAPVADGWSAGLHWHWSQHVRLFADLERTTFVGGHRDAAGKIGNRATELAILTRAQVGW